MCLGLRRRFFPGWKPRLKQREATVVPLNRRGRESLLTSPCVTWVLAS